MILFSIGIVAFSFFVFLVSLFLDFIVFLCLFIIFFVVAAGGRKEVSLLVCAVIY